MEKFKFKHQGNDCMSYTSGRFKLYVEKMKPDKNGNPRYKVSPSKSIPATMGHTFFQCTSFSRRYVGAGRNYAVLQSYHIDESIANVMEEWVNLYYKRMGFEGGDPRKRVASESLSQHAEEFPHDSEVRYLYCETHQSYEETIVSYDIDGEDVRVTAACGCQEDGSFPLQTFRFV